MLTNFLNKKSKHASKRESKRNPTKDTTSSKTEENLCSDSEVLTFNREDLLNAAIAFAETPDVSNRDSFRSSVGNMQVEEAAIIQALLSAMSTTFRQTSGEEEYLLFLAQPELFKSSEGSKLRDKLKQIKTQRDELINKNKIWDEALEKAKKSRMDIKAINTHANTSIDVENILTFSNAEKAEAIKALYRLRETYVLEKKNELLPKLECTAERKTVIELLCSIKKTLFNRKPKNFQELKTSSKILSSGTTEKLGDFLEMAKLEARIEQTIKRQKEQIREKDEALAALKAEQIKHFSSENKGTFISRPTSPMKRENKTSPQYRFVVNKDGGVQRVSSNLPLQYSKNIKENTRISSNLDDAIVESFQQKLQKRKNKIRELDQKLKNILDDLRKNGIEVQEESIPEKNSEIMTIEQAKKKVDELEKKLFEFSERLFKLENPPQDSSEVSRSLVETQEQLEEKIEAFSLSSTSVDVSPVPLILSSAHKKNKEILTKSNTMLEQKEDLQRNQLSNS